MKHLRKFQMGLLGLRSMWLWLADYLNLRSPHQYKEGLSLKSLYLIEERFSKYHRYRRNWQTITRCSEGCSKTIIIISEIIICRRLLFIIQVLPEPPMTCH
jgi:hypothetical protein